MAGIFAIFKISENSDFSSIFKTILIFFFYLVAHTFQCRNKRCGIEHSEVCVWVGGSIQKMSPAASKFLVQDENSDVELKNQDLLFENGTFPT